jgi:hypothetical protein
MSSKDEPPSAPASSGGSVVVQGRLPRVAAGPAAPTLAQLVRLLPLFRGQLREAEQRAQQAMHDAESLRKIVDGLEGLAGNRPSAQAPLFTPSETEKPEEASPRGQEAVRQVMLTDPDAEWPLARITYEVLRRGWIDPNAKVPRAAIRAATQRLAAANLADKTGTGRYRLTDEGRASPDD